MSVNILFYSNKCEGSQILISMMRSEGLLKYFKEICTDNNPTISSQIPLTPTLIIRGRPEPYVTTQAFSWFAQVKQARIQNQLQYMATEQKKYMQNNLSQNACASDTSVLLGWNKTEMEGMSDIFAFISDTASAVPHSQLSVNNIENHKILGDRYGNDEEKITEAEQITYNRRLQADRQSQDNFFKKQIDMFMEQQYK